MAIGKKTGGRDFLPGQSGNPKGRPKEGETLTDILKDMMEELRDIETEDGTTRTKVKYAFLEKVLAKAIKEGDTAAINQIWDRMEGKPRQTVRIENELDREWLETFKELKDEADAETEKDSNSGRERKGEDTDT